MTTVFKSASRPTVFAAAFIALTVAFSAGAAAAETPRAQTIGRPVAAPAGFLEFCRREPSECRTARQGAADDAQIQREASSLYWSNGFGGDGEAAVRSWRAQAARQAAGQAELEYQSINESISGDSLDDVAPQASGPLMVERAPERLNMTPDAWRQVNGVNDRANTRIAYTPDRNQYARNDYWNEAPAAGAARGDCEDYVLTKRRELIASGVSPDALSVAIVQTPRGETHSVLVMATRDGDYVLDNINPRIVRWDQTGYRWISRQAPGAVFDWVAVAG